MRIACTWREYAGAAIRAASRISFTCSGSSARRQMASANACGSSGGMQIPAPVSSIISVASPRGPEKSNGTPLPIASNIFAGRVDEKKSFAFRGISATLHIPHNAGIISFGCLGTILTFVRRIDLARASIASLLMPDPAKKKAISLRASRSFAASSTSFKAYARPCVPR